MKISKLLILILSILPLCLTACSKSEKEQELTCKEVYSKMESGQYPGGREQFYKDAINGKFGRWCKVMMQEEVKMHKNSIQFTGGKEW